MGEGSHKIRWFWKKDKKFNIVKNYFTDQGAFLNQEEAIYFRTVDCTMSLSMKQVGKFDFISTPGGQGCHELVQI